MRKSWRLPLEQRIERTEREIKKQVCIGKIFGSAIFEQIGEKYAVYQELTDGTWELTTMSHYEQFTPMPKSPLTHPTQALEYESPDQLYKDVKTYIHTHLDLLNELGYDILASFVFSTWISELFDFTGYISLFGRESVGKTRALEVLNELCFRAWLTTGLTVATLFRLVERFEPTLLLDESEFLTSKDRQELIGLLNAGQRKGIRVPRMKGEHFEEFDFYSVYCPKVIAGTEKLRKTTTSRMIVFNMTKNTRPVPRRVDKKEGLQLRNQLLMWRFRKIAELKDKADFKEKIQPSYQLTATEEYPELEELSGRSFELFFPLYHSAPTNRQNILEFALDLEKMKLSQERAMLSSLIFEAIVKLRHEAKRGVLLIRDIKRYVNFNEDPSNWISSKTVANKCEQMGFTKTRISEGTGIFINQKILDRLKKDPRYTTDLTNWSDEGNEPAEVVLEPEEAKKREL